MVASITNEDILTSDILMTYFVESAVRSLKTAFVTTHSKKQQQPSNTTASTHRIIPYSTSYVHRGQTTSTSRHPVGLAAGVGGALHRFE